MEHRGEQRAEHQHVGGGRVADEHGERAHERGGAAVVAVEQVGNGVERRLARAARGRKIANSSAPT
jgi:hypothetical protein